MLKNNAMNMSRQIKNLVLNKDEELRVHLCMYAYSCLSLSE